MERLEEKMRRPRSERMNEIQLERLKKTFAVLPKGILVKREEAEPNSRILLRQINADGLAQIFRADIFPNLNERTQRLINEDKDFYKNFKITDGDLFRLVSGDWQSTKFKPCQNIVISGQSTEKRAPDLYVQDQLFTLAGTMHHTMSFYTLASKEAQAAKYLALYGKKYKKTLIFKMYYEHQEKLKNDFLHSTQPPSYATYKEANTYVCTNYTKHIEAASFVKKHENNLARAH